MRSHRNAARDQFMLLMYNATCIAVLTPDAGGQDPVDRIPESGGNMVLVAAVSSRGLTSAHASAECMSMCSVAAASSRGLTSAHASAERMSTCQRARASADAVTLRPAQA